MNPVDRGGRLQVCCQIFTLENLKAETLWSLKVWAFGEYFNTLKVWAIWKIKGLYVSQFWRVWTFEHEEFENMIARRFEIIWGVGSSECLDVGKIKGLRPANVNRLGMWNVWKVWKFEKLERLKTLTCLEAWMFEKLTRLERVRQLKRLMFRHVLDVFS